MSSPLYMVAAVREDGFAVFHSRMYRSFASALDTADGYMDDAMALGPPPYSQVQMLTAPTSRSGTPRVLRVWERHDDGSWYCV